MVFGSHQKPVSLGLVRAVGQERWVQAELGELWYTVLLSLLQTPRCACDKRDYLQQREEIRYLSFFLSGLMGFS